MDLRDLGKVPRYKLEPIITFPWMGKKYTLLIKEMMESLGLKVILPPPISEKTVQLGVRHSSDMMCFPYKTNLGNFIEALELGANTLMMYDNGGQCRQRHYWKIHEITLRNMGYEFDMYPISRETIIPVLHRVTGKSVVKIINMYETFAKRLRELDAKRYQWSYDKLNIGLIGEIYSCCEEKVNYNIEQKLRKFGVNPYNTATLNDFFSSDMNINLVQVLKGWVSGDLAPINNEIFRSDSIPPNKLVYYNIAKRYLNGPVGGHGFENIYNLLWMADRGVSGVIHILPLSCMPETTVEPIINIICQEKKIPLLRLPIDETNSEANVDTRVETFVELIKRKDIAERRKRLEMLAGD